MVDRRWAIDWDEALAPPLAMIPDVSIVIFPGFDDFAPAGAGLSRPGAINCAATADCAGPPEWEDALLVDSGNVEAGGAEPPPLLGKVEEEEAAAFQRDSLHL